MAKGLSVTKCSLWVGNSAAADRRRKHRPYREPPVVGPHPPVARQLLDDAEAAAAQRGERHGRLARPGRASPVADRDFHRIPGHDPGHLEPRARQRAGMAYGVGEQLADDEGGVADGSIKDADGEQVLGEAAPHYRDAGRRGGQEHDARPPHLLSLCPDAPTRETAGCGMPSSAGPETGLGLLRARRAVPVPGKPAPLLPGSRYHGRFRSTGGPARHEVITAAICPQALGRRWTGEPHERSRPLNGAGRTTSGQLDPADPGQARAGAQPADPPGAEAHGGRLRTAVSHPALRHLALLILYLAAGIAATWPL